MSWFICDVIMQLRQLTRAVRKAITPVFNILASFWRAAVAATAAGVELQGVGFNGRLM